MSEPLSDSDPRAIGAYRLVGRLGAGGMGQVYLGESGSGRQVAVKLVRPEVAEDPGFRRRFRREVELAMRAGGFWSAPVVDADAEAERPWVASQYVPGPSLAELVSRQGPLDAARVRRLGAGLAEALAAFHRVGLVHRDLKPSNVLILDDGPRVIDFGISKALESDGGTELTKTGWLVGTPGFMSPEQAMGGPVDTPSDVFSLGSVLIHAATGRGPFGHGATPVLLFRVVHEPPDMSGVPEELRPVVTACLAKDAGDRPTAAEVAERLAARPVDAAGGQLQDRAATVVDPSAGSTPPGAGRPPTVLDPPEDVTRTAEAPPQGGMPDTVPVGSLRPTVATPDGAASGRPASVPQGPAAGRPAAGDGGSPADLRQPALGALSPAATALLAEPFDAREGGARVVWRRMWGPVLGAAAGFASIYGGSSANGAGTLGLATGGALAGLVLLIAGVPELPFLIRADLRADAEGLSIRHGKRSFTLPWGALAAVSFTEGRGKDRTIRVRALVDDPGRTPVPAWLQRPGGRGAQELEYRIICRGDKERMDWAKGLRLALLSYAGGRYQPLS
ncbi:serine/threonine-protein kinase [Streptomyces sp. TS71-3]|uniref:serine/threonine-protein kinase n=1 Tax=Streptomyces sp. TS71-3 TaxID=2733862 RepID=UPI001BB3A79D|nr:serine/threonine-protein kinase [Streptomyces sp. TS71-3]